LAFGPRPAVGTPPALDSVAMMNKEFNSHVQLDAQKRKILGEHLNRTLASSVDLHTQIKQAHWNIKGAHFVSRHELFDTLADRMRGFADDLAERASTLGNYATGTARLAAERSVIPEYDLDAIDGRSHIEALVHRYARFTSLLREQIGVAQKAEDPATEDLWTSVLRKAEMDLWFLESHLNSDQR
jgi:starvation-inducible DNA-binding protein